MALYETVFIARPDLAAEEVDNLTDKLSKIITDGKGKIASKEYWGLRSLAFKINKNSRGHYVVLNIDSDFEAVAEMKRVIGFNEDIIRSNIFKVEAHSGPSSLMISANAKDYKAGKVVTVAKSETDSVIERIIINN